MNMYNVFGTFGRLDRNYHVIADNNMEARKRVRAHDPKLSIVAVTRETVEVYVEMGQEEAFQTDMQNAIAHDGLILYDEGT